MVKILMCSLALLSSVALAQDVQTVSVTMTDSLGSVLGSLSMMDAPAPYFGDPNWNKDYSPSVIILPRLDGLPAGSIKIDVLKSTSCASLEGPADKTALISVDDSGLATHPVSLSNSTLAELVGRIVVLKGGTPYHTLACGAVTN